MKRGRVATKTLFVIHKNDFLYVQFLDSPFNSDTILRRCYLQVKSRLGLDLFGQFCVATNIFVILCVSQNLPFDEKGLS